MAWQIKSLEIETNMIRYFGNQTFARFLPPTFCAFVVFISGCVVGPNYKRPIVNSPSTFRGLTDTEAANPAPASLGDQKWWEVFQDQQLQQLIRTRFSRITTCALQRPASLRLKRSLELHARINFLP